MNHDHMSPTRHLVWMLGGGAGLFAVLLLAGVPIARALSLAALLACPLMMMAMMAHGPRPPAQPEDPSKAAFGSPAEFSGTDRARGQGTPGA